MDISLILNINNSDSQPLVFEPVENKENFIFLIKQCGHLSSPDVEECFLTVEEKTEPVLDLEGKKLPPNTVKKKLVHTEPIQTEYLNNPYNFMNEMQLKSTVINTDLEFKKTITLQDFKESEAKLPSKLINSITDLEQAFKESEAKLPSKLINSITDLELQKIITPQAFKESEFDNFPSLINSTIVHQQQNINNVTYKVENSELLNKKTIEVNVTDVESYHASNNDLSKKQVFIEEGQNKENKPKIKNQIQSSLFNEMSEFNSIELSENKNNAVSAKEVETQVLHYDRNNLGNFEKGIGERLISMIQENNHQATIKIDPPELGRIDIDLQLKDEKTNLSFYTTNIQVKNTLENSMGELKTMLNQQDLTLGEVTVFHQSFDDHKGNKKNQRSELFYHEKDNDPTNALKSPSFDKPLSRSGTINIFV